MAKPTSVPPGPDTLAIDLLEKLYGPQTATLFHYSLRSENSLKQLLKTVADSLLSHKHIHDWDDVFETDTVKKVARFVKDKFAESPVTTASYLVNFNIVQEVYTIKGRNIRRHTPRNPSHVTSQLFPSGLSENELILLDCGNEKPEISYGRIVELKEDTPALHRASLLLLHACCLRLYHEDLTFIRSFVQRHISLRTTSKEPYLFQEASPSDDENKFYKRVSLSFHLPHFLLQSEPPQKSSECLDRELIGYYGPSQPVQPAEEDEKYLYKASSSVLLTLVKPEECASRQEHVPFLSDPQCLWNVIIINGSWHAALTSSQEPVIYSTPVAQFVRGICGAVISKKSNLLIILQELKGSLKASETDSLFDDGKFSKSRTYHWVIATCHELYASLQSGMKFLDEYKSNQLVKLRDMAHPFEKPGIEYWMLRLNEEGSELAKLQTEVQIFKEQVRELRDAMQGATSLLQSHVAIVQGDRLKTLTYLGIAYLPLGTVSSIYSMSVLPKEADLGSYFVVLAIFLVLTLLLAMHIQVVSQFRDKPDGKNELGILMTEAKTRAMHTITSTSSIVFQSTIQFFQDANGISKRHSNKLLPRSVIFLPVLIGLGIIRLVFFVSSIIYFVMWKLPPDEVMYSLNLLTRPRATILGDVVFTYRKFFWDILRFLCFPVWLPLLVIRGLLAVLYFMAGWIWRVFKRIFCCSG